MSNLNIVEIFIDSTLDPGYNCYLVNTSAADRNITMSVASGNDGLIYYVKNEGGSNNVIISCQSSEQIDGGSTITLAPNEHRQITAYSGNWYCI